MLLTHFLDGCYIVWVLKALSLKMKLKSTNEGQKIYTDRQSHTQTIVTAFFLPVFHFIILFYFFLQCVLHLAQKSPSSTVFDHKQSALGIYMSKTEISMLVQLSGEHLLSIYVSTSICCLFLKAINNSLSKPKLFIFFLKS